MMIVGHNKHHIKYHHHNALLQLSFYYPRCVISPTKVMFGDAAKRQLQQQCTSVILACQGGREHGT